MALQVQEKGYIQEGLRQLYNQILTMKNKSVGFYLAAVTCVLSVATLILLLVYLPCWCLRKWRLSRACAGGTGDAA